MMIGFPARLLLLIGTGAFAGCASTRTELASADSLSLGRNAGDDPCRADRTWGDASVPGQFDRSYVITCRGVTASRAVGFLRAVVDRPEAVAAVEASLACGEMRPVALEGIGTVDARRCFDRALGEQVVVLSFRHGDRRVIASAVPAVLGPLEQGVRQLAGGATGVAANARSPSTIELASLAPAPGGAAEGVPTADFNSAVALQQGISLNHKGLHLEASRLLNDALSRLPADASPAVRAELLLEAGLADSNIRVADAAAEHFARANAILASFTGGDQQFLLRKRDIYSALDLLNRRQFRAALRILDRIAGPQAEAGEPLRDPAIVQALNQAGSASGDVSRAVVVLDSGTVSQLVLQTQAHWARSIALLALNDLAGADAALSDAGRSFAPLGTSRINPVPLLWMQARIERQRGRIALRRGDWAAARTSFDQALDALTRGSLGTAGTGGEPAIAELRLERASITLQRGATAEEVERDYDEAIDALIASGASGVAVSNGLDRYLRFLIEHMEGPGRGDSQERFFRAIQVAGEPALARQMNQLQNVLSADPAVGARLRNRADLERELVSLRYEIAAADPQDAAQAPRIAALEARRQEAQSRLLAVQNDLAGDTRFGTVEERPATLAEVRSALRPGEVYFKISEVGGRTYGMVIADDATFIYQIVASPAQLRQFARMVRASIDGRMESEGKLVPFDVAASYTLFGLLTGPARDRLLRASSLIVDPAGPLQSLPAGILVTDRASVDAYRASARRRGSEFDFSHVSFLAGRAAISTAVSPHSFLTVRRLPPSSAPQPFIAFAEPAPPPPSDPARTIDLGAGCTLGYQQLVELWTNLPRIDAREARIAADALGAPGAPVVSGVQFTDSALLSRHDLNQYQVLHFATHGFAEGQWGCARSPPALLTSLADADSNGLLSFSEIAGLRLDANLVVLSACDTGAGLRSQALARRSGQEETGATLEGLVRAFLTANARAVMATHWQVSAAREGTDFMRDFYQSARSQPIGGALQSAQRTMIAQPNFSHPFYWGAYFVVGDGGKMMVGGNARVANAPGGATQGAN